MSYKSLLVYLDDGKSNAERIGVAIETAQAHGAHLTGAALLTLKPDGLNTHSDKVMALEAKRLSERLVAEFEAQASAAKIAHEAIVIAGNSDASAGKMAHHARNNDLVILAQPNPDSRNFTRMSQLAEEVILYSGRPVMFVPYIGTNNVPFKKALISWDGTPAAARATYDAIPLLKHCEDVAIMVVQSKKQLESKTDDQAEALATNLKRHDIHTHVERIAPGSATVANIILNEVAHNNIDILVMGGYGTPSLRQKIMGGVTRTLLSTMLIPVLMAH